MSENMVLIYIGHGYINPEIEQLNSLRNVDKIALVVGFDSDSSNQRYTYGSDYNSTVTQNAVQDVNDFIKNIFMQSDLYSNGVKVYIGIPRINTGDNKSVNNMDAFYPIYKNYLNGLKDSLREIFDLDFIEGIYCTIEAVYPVSEHVDPRNLMSNGTLALYNDLSYMVRNVLNKKFMWTPYYASGVYADTIAWNLGMVANRTNLFDYILVQPSWYFNPKYMRAPKANLSAVVYSMEKQALTYRDGSIVGGARTSTLAQIGVVMELDADIYRNLEYPDPSNTSDGRGCLDHYHDYEVQLATLQSTKKYPFIYYAGSEYDLFSDPTNVQDSSIVLRKKITDVIGDFYS